MQKAAASAYLIETSVGAAWQFVIQLTALTSGAIKEDDYVFELPQSKL